MVGGAEEMPADGAAIAPAENDVRVNLDLFPGSGKAAGDGKDFDLLVHGDLLVLLRLAVPVRDGGAGKGADAVEAGAADAVPRGEGDQGGHHVVAVVEDQEKVASFRAVERLALHERGLCIFPRP